MKVYVVLSDSGELIGVFGSAGKAVKYLENEFAAEFEEWQSSITGDWISGYIGRNGGIYTIIETEVR